MKIENLCSYPLNLNANKEKLNEIIDFEMLKAILYLGIKGKVQVTQEEKHTIDITA